MRLGIISDTHNVLRKEVMEKLEECDCILHAGDFCKAEILEALEKIGPVYGVRGNNDKESWAKQLPIKCILDLDGCKIGMAHEKRELPQNREALHLMIYGHSHKFEVYQEEETWYVNPGSCGRKRFGLPLSFVIAEIGSGKICLKKIDI